MQGNKYSPLQRGSVKLSEITADQVRLIKEENQKLGDENTRLKKSLENEQFLHRNLYSEWKELKESLAATEFELKPYDKSSGWIFSRPAFYCLLALTLLLATLTVYNLYVGPGKNKILASVSTPVTIPGLSDSSSAPGLLNTNKSFEGTNHKGQTSRGWLRKLIYIQWMKNN